MPRRAIRSDHSDLRHSDFGPGAGGQSGWTYAWAGSAANLSQPDRALFSTAGRRAVGLGGGDSGIDRRPADDSPVHAPSSAFDTAHASRAGSASGDAGSQTHVARAVARRPALDARGWTDTVWPGGDRGLAFRRNDPGCSAAG